MCIHNCKDLSLKKKKNSGMWGKQKKIIVKVEYPKSKPAEFLSSFISFQAILLPIILFVGSYFECDLKNCLCLIYIPVHIELLISYFLLR